MWPVGLKNSHAFTQHGRYSIKEGPVVNYIGLIRPNAWTDGVCTPGGLKHNLIGPVRSPTSGRDHLWRGGLESTTGTSRPMSTVERR